MIRLVKLKVEDEIENGLVLPLRFSPRCRSSIWRSPRRSARSSTRPRRRAAALFRLGSWIGGDRDGNPLVNGATLSYAIDRQASVAFAHYLDEIHRLGAELSLSSRLVTPSPELMALADAAGDTNPHRNDEPYRQALIGIYARVAATAAGLSSYVPARVPHAELPPYANADELLADLRAIDASLALHGATPLANGRLVPLIRAVEVFGFHLAVLDLRQNSDVHEAVIAELLASAGVASERERIALLQRELASPRLLHSPHLAYQTWRV
jgi:phosphoenolpyruvate carboxylase